MEYYIADTFTDKAFCGNPAGVCVLEKSLDESIMQSIASENAQPETAFVLKKGLGEYNLRWFAQKGEIDLCGHGTLAAAFVISNFVDKQITEMNFSTQKKGILRVKKEGELYELDLPVIKSEKTGILDNLVEIIGVNPIEVYSSRDLVLIMQSEEVVKSLSPSFSKIRELEDYLGIIVASKGENSDFVCRCFYPKVGTDEDFVTASAHCILVPIWAEKLGKDEIISNQTSKREGFLNCRLSDDRVIISGKARLYLKGEISI